MVDPLSIPQSLYADLLDHVPACVYAKNKDGKYVYVNRAMLKWSGVERADRFVGLSDFDLMPADMALKCQLSDESAWASPHAVESEEMVAGPTSGQREPFLTRKFKLHDEHGQPYAVAGLSMPLSYVRSVEQGLYEAQQRYQALYATGKDAIVFADANGVVVDCNPSAEQIFGAPREAIVGRTLVDFSPPRQPDGRKSLLAGRRIVRRASRGESVCFDWMLLCPNGARIFVEIALTAVRLNGEPQLMACIRDVSEKRRRFSEMEHLANHDNLTGLANRARLLRELDRLTRLAPSGDPGFCLLLLDLDRFKEVNDTLGHQNGDDLLRTIAGRLAMSVENLSALTARLGGDEFAIVLRDMALDHAMAVARDLRLAVAEPVTLCGLTVEVGASIGLVHFPEHGADTSTLMRSADIAMYSAKQKRTGMAVYQPGMNFYTHGRLALLADLSEAIRKNQLMLYFQPQVRVVDKARIGWEALVRWRHPERGLILPGDFICLAEMSDAIHALTYWTIERALRTWRDWADAGRHERIALNLSARSLADETLVARVDDLLRRYAVAPECITLELTETSILHDVDVATAALSQLRAKGLSIAMDDFGSGYTALAQLSRLPVDTLKIDRGFVNRIATNARDCDIAEAIVRLAHTLEMDVVAEGVESEEIFNTLRTMRCDAAQGYWCGEPVAEPF